MRIITDSDGRVLDVSFGALISCGGQDGTDYTGTVPTGYTSLEDWFIKEADKLYRWTVVDGELTLDSSAVAPVDLPVADYIVERGTSGIWTYEKWNSGKAVCWGTSDLPASTTPELKVVLPFNMADTKYVVSLTPGHNASVLTTPIRECRITNGNSVRTVNSFYVSAKCSSSYSVRFGITVAGRWK